MMDEKLLNVKNVKKYFPVRGSRRGGQLLVKALDDVSLDIREGETLGLVGESGCGKTTMGRCAIGLLPVTEGFVSYRGTDITALENKRYRALTREVQMIFQDPYSSLNPRMTAGEAVQEPLRIHKVCGARTECTQRAMEMFERVGLRRDQFFCFPHELSGGQRQRVGIARALVLRPRLLVCDEPVSALDVSIQSQILNLLRELRETLDVTYFFISHNMSVVRYISDRVGVMYLGRLMEISPGEELYARPLHPYTRALLSAVPETGEKKQQTLLRGDIPSPLNPPPGCAFHPRCPYAEKKCAQLPPRLTDLGGGHHAACFRL
ncbi:MAG: ATP-binding cassette domain-containing protein [Treponema sp.]|jgi:oligopeptide/dipeptide ABC transporter ATP-binding protein|nr:ATP-binding cassette domain-containing protein [Treponema sp.]